MTLAEDPLRFQRGYYRRIEFALAAALAVHLVVFAVAPPYVPRPYQLAETPLRLVQTLEGAAGRVGSPTAAEPIRPPITPRAPAFVTEQLRMSASVSSAKGVPAAGPAGAGAGSAAGEAPDAGETPQVYYAFDSPPVIRRRVEPEYPTAAKTQGAEGTVILNANIDETGRILRVWVVQSTAPEILIQTAIDALYQFEFTPGSSHGNPVRCTVSIPFKFTLDQHL